MCTTRRYTLTWGSFHSTTNQCRYSQLQWTMVCSTPHGTSRVVFNCSFSHKQTNLNENVLLNPTLGSPLLGVLLRFRQYATAISGDIRAMFHQIRLLPEDQPLLCFLWRKMERDRTIDIYQVLPFGTTCRPCSRDMPETTVRKTKRLLSLSSSLWTPVCSHFSVSIMSETH